MLKKILAYLWIITVIGTILGYVTWAAFQGFLVAKAVIAGLGVFILLISLDIAYKVIRNDYYY